MHTFKKKREKTRKREEKKRHVFSLIDCKQTAGLLSMVLKPLQTLADDMLLTGVLPCLCC